MATHSSIFAWKIPWIEEPGGLQSMGLQRDMTECTHQRHTDEACQQKNGQLCLSQCFTNMFDLRMVSWSCLSLFFEQSWGTL